MYAPNVTKIYVSAFANCESITLVSDKHPGSDVEEGVYLPNLEETIGFSFSGAKNLETVSLSKLKTLGESGYDFQSTHKLKNVYLPLITSIPEGTFNQSTGLGGTFEIGEFAFSGEILKAYFSFSSKIQYVCIIISAIIHS